MTYTYKTKGTCSTQIDLELEGNIVHNVKFTGGCNGNLQAIPKLVEGLTVEQVEEKIGGISCITNLAAGMGEGLLSHEEVKETADRVKVDFIRLVTALTSRM